MQSVVTGLVVGYALVMAGVAAAIVAIGDASAAGMLLLFGPRWLLPWPWLVLVPLAWRARWWVRGAAVLGAAVTLFGVALWNVPFARLRGPASDDAAGPTLRVVTWNTDGRPLTAEQLAAYLPRWNAQLVLLQDCRGDALTVLARRRRDFSAYRDGEFCVISRLPAHRLAVAAEGKRRAGRAIGFDVAWAGRLLRMVTVHLPSPRDELGAARQGNPSRLAGSVAERSAASQRLSEWALAGARQADALVVAGDFNLPYGSRALRRDWGTLRNAFADAGWGLGHTMFAGRHRVRIDHVLASPTLVARSARVLSGYPAEHQPVVVEYGWR